MRTVFQPRSSELTNALANRSLNLMYKIVEARSVGLNIKQFVIEAPRIARKQKPGQFLILRLHERASAFRSPSNRPTPWRGR